MYSGFIETIEKSPRPEIIAGFDDFMEEIGEVYTEANSQDIELVPVEQRLARAYAGPTVAGTNTDSTTYHASTPEKEANIEVEVRDYSRPDLETMLENQGGSTTISTDASRNHLRDIVLKLEEGSDLLFDLVGDAAYDLLEPYAADYERDETGSERRRRFVFERRDVERL